MRWDYKEWVGLKNSLPPAPPLRVAGTSRFAANEGIPPTVLAFLVYILGVGAVVALLLVMLQITRDPTIIAAILAPVTGVIGAFTGHAAGHAAARH